MKKVFLLFAALAIVLSVSLADYRPASAQYSCNYSCYYAYGIYLKNSNGTPFTGYATIYSGAGHPTQTNKHFTNGVMDSGYIWSGYAPYTWYNIGLQVYVGGVSVGQGIISRRYSTVPYLPDGAIVTFW